jgi:DNA polymerase III subunit epsilon
MTPRILISLTFAGLIVAVVAVASWLEWSIGAVDAPPQAVHKMALLYGIGAAFALIAVLGAAWALLDRRLATPLRMLTREIETAAHVDAEHQLAPAGFDHLTELTTAVAAMMRELADARRQAAETVAEASRRAESEKAQLETILRDLHEGVIVCNLNHQVLLYNRRALELLHMTGEMGLGRSLFTVMNRQPFLHAVEILTDRLGDGQAAESGDAGTPDATQPFMATTADGRTTFEGRMRLILDAAGKVTGYVITFEDNSRRLAALGRRDHLLSEATEGLRQRVSSLAAAAETLEAFPAMAAGKRKAFEKVMFDETRHLSRRLDALAAEYRELVTGAWPMVDVFSANLLNGVVRRLRDDKKIPVVMTGLPCWLHGDSYTLVELLDHLIERAREATDAAEFDIEAVPGDNCVYLDIVWKGPVIPAGELATWLGATLTGAFGALTARDVLDHHKTELWSQPHRDGYARLRLPLPAAVGAPPDRGRRRLPSRPEFYDFDLLRYQMYSGALGRRSLKSLSFVVFDTETTGLRPSEGDEIVSLAGVRVINGRILTGESFSHLIHPGRDIPEKSRRFHGITDEMVAGKPSIQEVMPAFKRFVGDSVLVAHNAAFDMKFLKLKEAAAGVVFDTPVLDTLLLSAYLHDHQAVHTLEAIAKRFGVEVRDRHTALGDSLVTAAVFLRMIEMLEARGIITLDQALAAANSMAEFRARQAEF